MDLRRAVRHNGPSGAKKVLFLHGFTGAPLTFAPQIRAAIDVGYDVSAPLLPGHGTEIAEMVPTRYEDYFSACMDALEEISAGDRLVTVVGISMGGTLALDLALADARVDKLILINPLVVPPADSFIALLEAALAQGIQIAPGIGSDIADPSVHEDSYDGSPVAAALSLYRAADKLYGRVSALQIPVLLFNSQTDHVVLGESGLYLAEHVANLRRVVLERSYHVATLDYDRDVITAGMLEFLAAG